MSRERLSWFKAAPGAYEALRGVEAYIRKCGLEPSLVELANLRASQINGCAYCLDMHSKDARRAGRDRATAVSSQRVARVAALHRPRAGGAGMDRGADADG